MSADIDAHNNEIKNEFSDVENADENLTKSQYNNSNSKNNANNKNVRSDDGEDFIDNDDLSDANNGGPDSPKFIRLRGLPWSATHQEILDFLKGVSVVNGSKGIHLVTSRWDGKNTGEAYVEVETQEDVEEARKLNKALMEHRYIEVFSANSKEAKEAMRKTGSHSGSYVVKLRGLPYAVTEKQIEEFFSGLEIKPDREGILFVMDRRGRATGEAFVQFETHDDTEQALGRNREKIGHRYIEIFRSSIAELKRAAPGNGRPVPYDIKDRGSNRGGGGGFNDYNNVGRNNSRDPWNHSNFNMGANNTLGFNSPTNFTNSGNFGNVFGPKNNLSSNNGNGGIFGHINNNNGNNNMNNSGGSPNGGNFGNFPNFSNNGNFGHTGGMNNNNNNNNNNNGATNNNNNIVNSGNFGNFNNNNNNGNNVRSMMGGTGMIGNGNNNSSGFSANNRFNNGNGNFGNDFGDFNNFGNQRNFNGNNFGNNNMNDFVVNRNNNNNMGNNNNNNNFGNFGNDNSAPNNCGNFNNGGCNYGPVGGGRGEFFTIHMRGMPYSCFENDVYKFFDPIRPVNVRINFNKKGLHSGTADVFFDVYEDAQLAMKRHREQMGSRYIELFFDGKTKGPPNNNFNNNNSRDNDDLSSNNNMMRGNNSGYNFSRRV